MTPNIMIHWCEICQHAPAEGVLEVIRKGETEIDFMQCCQACVDGLDNDDWI